MHTSRRPTLTAALLLPVVLFSVVWTSFALWRCQYDGLARRQCCCPERSPQQLAQAAAATPAHAMVGAPACCAIEHHQVEPAPAEAARGQAAQLAAAAVSAVASRPVGLLPLLEPPPATELTTAERPGPDPSRNRSLLAQKQALLI